MKHKDLTGIFCIYAVVMLCLLFFSVFILLGALRETDDQPTLQTEVVYVYLLEETETPTQEQTAPSQTVWFVKEYNGKIGIFKEDGTLTEVLDTYVKTLPAADQSLLREGITVRSREALRSLIEDYTS